MAVPRFITTNPPAKLASKAACRKLAPAASASVNAAMTVSPAPVTSTAWSDPKIGRCRGGGAPQTAPCRRGRASPAAPGRLPRAAVPSQRMKPLQVIVDRRPKASSTSGSLGVAAVILGRQQVVARVDGHRQRLRRGAAGNPLPANWSRRSRSRKPEPLEVLSRATVLRASRCALPAREVAPARGQRARSAGAASA